MVLDLAGDEESQWEGFNAKLRNQTRKAQKSGLSFVVGQVELLEDSTKFLPAICEILARRFMEKKFSQCFDGFSRLHSDSGRLL